ncbi:MAG: metallophosphoesterase [Clostridium sp.]|uniref:metallophosphoesterase n=1 Tax=Clostridium sp. TaxID=1506 RepID=UPI003F3EE954
MRGKIKMYLIIIIVILVALFLYVQNNLLYINKIELNSSEFSLKSDYKIVHLSDLHNKMFGDNQNKLVDKIKEIKPDMIVYTGDIVDSYSYKEEPALILMAELLKIAPVYYVTGNHEIRLGVYETLKEKFTKLGVTVLEDEVHKIYVEDNEIDLIGLKDGQIEELEYNLNEILINNKSDNFKMLLSHRPDGIEVYSNNNIDLAFTGHAHGGQVRIPFFGGIIAPGQGFFPEYTEGKHTMNNTTMVVSRGLGNSAFPFRILNRPEIVVLEIKGKY